MTDIQEQPRTPAAPRRHGHPPSLLTALVLFTVLPMLAILLGAGWYGLHVIQEGAEERMREEIELIARAIRQPLSHSMERDRPGSVEKALEAAFRFGRVYAAYVYDADGDLIASSGSRKASVAGPQAARLATDKTRQDEFREFSGEKIYSYFAPLTDSGGRVNGLLQVTRLGSDFQQDMAKRRNQALLAVIPVAALLVLLVLMGHQWTLGRPLRRIEGDLYRIGGGDHDLRLEPGGPRELRHLVSVINGMLDGLARSRRELEDRQARERVLEGRLRQSEKLAAIGQLAAGVAHELGTPLSVIDGHAQRALRREDLGDEAVAAFERTRGEVRRMESIVRQLLDFGRRNPPAVRPEPLDTLARAALAQVADEARREGVEVETVGDLPAPEVRVDRVRLEQALTNLLRNAIQAGRRVRLSWYHDAHAAGFVVEDDGPGIDDAVRSHLFEPFFTSKPVGQGTGLGLAVAHAAVADHGGRIELITGTLGGACFCIELPRTGEPS